MPFGNSPQLAKKLKAIVVCVNKRDEGGAIVASEKELHDIAEDAFQMSFVADIILSELDEI